MTETNRLVTEEKLLDEGYLKRGVYMVRDEGDVEVRFIYVCENLYEFDGVKTKPKDDERRVSFFRDLSWEVEDE